MTGILEIEKKLKYLEKNSNLVNKLYLRRLDDFVQLKDATKNCVLILKDIHNLTGFYNVKVKDIEPIIEKLKIIKDIIETDLIKLEIDDFFDLMYEIARNSYGLLSTKRFISNIHTGFFGSSDYIGSSNLIFDEFYYLEEEQFYFFIDRLATLTKLFETEGESKTKTNKEYNKFVKKIFSLIKKALIINEKYTPNSLLANPPITFDDFSSFGKKLVNDLQMIQFSYSLKELLDEINDAIEGLYEITKKYKNKPNKKITLEGIFYTRDGAKKLQEILDESRGIILKVK